MVLAGSPVGAIAEASAWRSRCEFVVRDLVEGELPDRDLCLVAMVLYLMCHTEVLAILPKLKKYRYVFPYRRSARHSCRRASQHRQANRQVHTPRLLQQRLLSGAASFNLDLEVVCGYRIPSGEILRTVLIES